MGDLVRISFHGEVVVGSCSLIYDGDGVKILSLDLKTKHAVVGEYGGNQGVVLHTTEASLYAGEKRRCTEVVFPRFRKYRVVAADCCRYTCFVALLKNDFFASGAEPIETEYIGDLQG